MKKTVRNSVILCVVGLLGFTSCKKDTVEIPESNDPVFRTDGTFGSENFEIVAGDDGAYMFTMTEVQNGINVFSGRISNGNFSIELGIYDGHVDMPGYDALNELLNITPTFSASDSTPVIVLSKAMLATMSSSQYIENINWYIDDVFAGTNEAVIYNPGKYNVRADIMFIGGGTASLTNEIIAGYQLGGNCMIEFSLGTQGLVSASIDAMGGTVEQVSWFLDEQPLAAGNYIQEMISPDFHVLTAEVHMKGGVVRRKSVLVNGSSWQHTVNDFTLFEFLADPDVTRDFNLRLLIEKDGKFYSSELAENESSTLSITGFEYYGKNEQGKDVYKIAATVNANVREVGSTKSVPVHFSTTFGIEIQ